MSSRSALELEYVTLSECAAQRRGRVLGGALFEQAPAAGGGEDLGFPIAAVRTPVLGEAREVLELWRIGDEVRAGAHGSIRYTLSRDFLFGSLSLHEDEMPGEPDARPRLQAATARAYRQICATLAAAGHPHLLRVWNFIPEINLETHGLERYRQFNSARQEALVACGRPVAGGVPAASALGSASGSPLVIYFLASRIAPAVIENPRQVSAYHYPEEYGPKSPVFSRATALGEPDAATLFISGTSSIVGHRTVHAGDTAAQTLEALANIEAVLEEAGRVALAAKPRLESLAYKVYVRDPGELPVIRSALAGAVGSDTPVLYLKADICRRDLAVEIEAVGGPGLRPGN